MKPSISIVIPVKNSEPFICECIKSILCQSFQDFEIIIVDDGCVDSTIPLIDSFKSEKIKIIQNSGYGISDALNFGIEQSKGYYICRMDSDDVCSPSRLENQFSLLQRTQDVDILGTQAFYGIDKSTSTLLESVVLHEDIKYSLLFQNPLVHSSIMFKKSSFLSGQLFYDSKYNGCEDYELWSRCMIRGLNFKVLNSPELFYRIHPHQFSQKGNTYLNNLSIKCNYGKFIFGNTVDCSSIEYLQLMTREIIFIPESYLENLKGLYNKLIDISRSKVLKGYLHHNLQCILNQLIQKK